MKFLEYSDISSDRLTGQLVVVHSHVVIIHKYPLFCCANLSFVMFLYLNSKIALIEYLRIHPWIRGKDAG